MAGFVTKNIWADILQKQEPVLIALTQSGFRASLNFGTCAAMQNIAPLDYERYAVLTNLFPKYGVESVAVKPSKRVTEPAAAVNTDVAGLRGMAARNMADGNVAPQTKTAAALTGGYLGYRLNDTGPVSLIWLGKASNGISDMAGNGPAGAARKVAALYERTDTMLR